MTNNRLTFRAVAMALALAMIAGGASAQYFGRNKVQWEDFDFKVLKTDHFDIYYYDDDAAVVRDVGRIAERWYDRLSRTFEHDFARKPFVLYANHADFQQTTTTTGLIGEGTGGFTDSIQNRMVLPLTGNWADNDHVIGHEMVHVFQYNIATTVAAGPSDPGDLSGQQRRGFALESLPLWLVEGMAEYFSKGRADPLTAMWLRDATYNDRLPDLQKLTRDPRYFPYRYGQALLAYIGGRYGDAAVVNLFMAAGTYGVEQSFSRALGVPHQQVFAEWHAAARALYEPIALRSASSQGSPLLGDREDDGGPLNLGPALSPDGKRVAFLSSRELFSIDLFIAESASGRVQRRLVQSGGDAHFDALRFIDTGGGWSPDSTKLAVVLFERGDNRLGIVDTERGGVEQRIRIPGVEAFANPSWSPDGKWIAVSDQSRGVSDIVIYNLETKQVRRLTNDPFSDLQPSWSPDGKKIAFSSDRGPSTDLALLKYGDLRISVVDVATGRVEVLPLFDLGKHINPQYGPDGSIYFVANPDGVSNVFRYSPDGQITRLTNVATGVAGITPLSPPLTVATNTGTIAFSLYENDNYNIYSLPADSPAQSVDARTDEEIIRAGVLPPAQPSRESLTDYLRRPSEGLPPQNTRFETTNYRPDLRLTYLGPPTVGVGVDTGGGYGIGGSVSAVFSDVLGEHLVGVTFAGGSSSGGFNTLFGGEAIYLNRQNRVNWGGSLTHIPYTAAGTRAYNDVIEIDGELVPATIYEQIRQTTVVDEVAAISLYPLSRTRRFEASLGYQHLGYESEIEREIYVGGQLIDNDTDDLPSPENLGYTRGSLAYVGDSSYFGYVSPVRGTRYRLEVEALSGDVEFNTALLDYRRYIFLRPFTLAVRALHFGRYGSGAEDPQVSPLYLGRYTLVRGYESDTFEAEECGSTGPLDNCPVFDRLIGSKIAMVGMELRVPLFGTEEYGLINAPLFPVELVGFFEGGAAWTEDQDPNWEWATESNERIPVFSAGVAARILLAYIPIQLYYAKPFQRPDSSWNFGFAITTGW